MNLYSKHTTPESLYGYEQIRRKYAKPTLEMCQKLMDWNFHENIVFNKFPYNFIQQSPDNLRVGGYLDLRNTPITHIGDNLRVGGNLDLRNTPITHIGDNLYVGYDLYIGNTPNLDKDNLPSDMQVRKIIY